MDSTAEEGHRKDWLKYVGIMKEKKKGDLIMQKM